MYQFILQINRLYQFYRNVLNLLHISRNQNHQLPTRTTTTKILMQKEFQLLILLLLLLLFNINK